MLFRSVVMGQTWRINAPSWQSAGLCFLYMRRSVGLETKSVNKDRHRSINRSTLSLMLSVCPWEVVSCWSLTEQDTENLLARSSSACRNWSFFSWWWFCFVSLEAGWSILFFQFPLVCWYSDHLGLKNFVTVWLKYSPASQAHLVSINPQLEKIPKETLDFNTLLISSISRKWLSF